jgi:hypothetical protein
MRQAGHFLRSMLISADTFILECGSEVYAWVGKGSNPEEKKSAMINAQARSPNLHLHSRSRTYTTTYCACALLC